MRSVIIVLFLFLLAGCGTSPLTYAERTLNDLYPILSPIEEYRLESLSDSAAVDLFVEQFWMRADTVEESGCSISRTEYNERVAYANTHFPDRWGRSDRKKIYLLYGPPSSVERREANNFAVGSAVPAKSLEVWLYMTGGKHNGLPAVMDDIHPGEMKFIFGDRNGAGDFRLIYSSEDSQDTDARLYRRP